MRVAAPAKVNLVLSVGPRREDGYHDLDTLFQAVDLCDEVEVARGGEGLTLDVEGGDAGPPGQNLVARAARAFLAAAGLEEVGLRLALVKRIPTGAGLGGGSSDAAATLRALDRLFPGRLDGPALAGLAEGLGSDVPFFLGSSPLARGRGRGERLDPLPPLPPLPGVVVMPPVHVATPGAYRSLDRWRDARGWTPPARAGSAPTGWTDLAARARNDFEDVVVDEVPEVARVLTALRGTRPLLALLSGSGAACFALFRTNEEVERAVVTGDLAELGRVYRIRTLTGWPDAGE